MKKGFVFIPLLVTLSLVVLTLSLYLHLTLKRESSTSVLGELQTDSFENIYGSEKSIFEIENNVRYNVIRSLSKLAERGGVKDDNIWTETAIREVPAIFKQTFENEMKEYLSKTYADLSYNYLYELDNGKIEIIGLASREFTFAKGISTYKIKPNFNREKFALGLFFYGNK